MASTSGNRWPPVAATRIYRPRPYVAQRRRVRTVSRVHVLTCSCCPRERLPAVSSRRIGDGDVYAHTCSRAKRSGYKRRYAATSGERATDEHDERMNANKTVGPRLTRANNARRRRIRVQQPTDTAAAAAAPVRDDVSTRVCARATGKRTVTAEGEIRARPSY